MATTKDKKADNKLARTRVAAAKAAPARTSTNVSPRAVALAVATAFMPWVVPQVGYAQTPPGPAPNTVPTVVLTGGDRGSQSGRVHEAQGGFLQIDQFGNLANFAGTVQLGSAAQMNVSQPHAGAVAVFKDTSGVTSQIWGRVTANGQLFFTNSAGVYFGRTAEISVGSLLATTLSVETRQGPNGQVQADLVNKGATGKVINEGRIVTANGYTALVGPQVRNDGVIIARSGSVALVAGNRVSLDLIGDGLISVSVDEAALNASVVHTGHIEADGGRVLLSARSANALLDTVINSSGVIRANSLVERNGEIVLDGGSSGTVAVSGTLQAAGVDAGTTGGTIKVLGDKVGLFGSARLDASGHSGGGTVLVGGNYQGQGPEHNATAVFMSSDALITADAVSSGNGGTAILWSDGFTSAHGTIYARGGAQGGDGGLIETSGHQILDATGVRGSAGAANGNGGLWLFDPDSDVTITTATANNAQLLGVFTPIAINSTIDAADINGVLNGGTDVTVITTFATGSQNGNIFVNAPITYGSGTGTRTLTLNAGSGGGPGSVEVNAAISGSATRPLNVVLDSATGGAANGSVKLNAGGNITTFDGNLQVLAGAGGVTQVATNTVDTGTGTITVNGGGGPVNMAGTLTTTNATANAVTIRNATTAAIGNIIANGAGAVVRLGVGQDITGALSQNLGTLISANTLEGSTAGTVTLANANAINTLGAFTSNGFSLRDTAGGLSVAGTVDAGAGTVLISTDSGDLTLSSAIQTTNASASAVILNAGSDATAGTAAGGDIIVTGGSITTGAGGRATLFTGRVSGSSGVTAFVGSGSGNFRYNSDEATSNYTAALGAGTFAVYREQPLLDVTVTSSTTKVYGTDDPGPRTFTASGYVNGDSAGLTGSFGRNAGESVGSYTVTAGSLQSDVGYGFNFTQSLSITKANLTATVANQSKVYGADDPTLASVNVTLGGIVNASVTDWNGNNTPIDDSALTSSATSLMRTVGESVAGAPYSITAGTFTTPSTNYNAPTLVAGSTLDITEASLTATVNATKTYGADDPLVGTVPVVLTGLINRTVSTWNGNVAVDDTALTSAATALTRTGGETVAAGPYSILTGTFSTPSTNYNAPTLGAGSDLTINAANVTASVANQSKVYGADDPALASVGVTLNGLINRTVSTWNGNVAVDDSALTSSATSLTRTVGESVAGAPYSITAGTFTTPSTNYNAPTLVAGSTLEITEASLTATVANQTKVYGADDPALASVGVTLNGLINRTVSTWNGNVAVDDSGLASSATSLTRTVGENVAGAPYAITAGGFTTPSTNYNAPTLVAGSTLDITEASLTATVADQTKVYGADDPALASVGVTLNGLINRTVSTWNGNVAVDDSALGSSATSLTRTVGETVAGAPYAITAGSFTTPSTNYNAPTLVAGSTLDITEASLTATVADQTKVYGADDPALASVGVTLNGLINRMVSTWNGNVAVDDSALASSATSLTRVVGESVAAAPYSITAGTFTTPSTNYNAPTLAAGSTLDITEASLTATVADQTKTYGTGDPSLASVGVTLGGLVNRSVTDWNGNATPINDSALTSTATSLNRVAGEDVAGAPYSITAGTFTTPSTNYSAPALVAGSTLDITPKTVSLAATREYDGSGNFTAGAFTPTISGTVASTSWSDWNGNVTNVAGAQALTIASGTGTVPGDDVNPLQTLTVGGLALGNGGNGGLATNYTFAGGTHTATITRRTLVTWTGAGDGISWSDAANWGGAIPDLANVADVNLGGANVNFTSAVPALAGSVQIDNLAGGALSMSSGTLAIALNGSLTGYGQSGGTLNAGSMTVASAAAIAQTGGSLNVAGASSFSAGANPITLTGTNDFGGAVTLANSGSNAVQINDVDDIAIASASLGGALTVNSGGLITLGNVTTTGTQQYNNNVQLNNEYRTNGGHFNVTGTTTVASNSTITSDAGDVTLGGALNGPAGLTVNSSGATIFTSTVGSSTALASLTTDAAGTTSLAGNVTATGSILLQDPTTASGVTLTSTGGSTIFYHAAGSAPISVSTTNAVAFDGALLGTAGSPIVFLVTPSVLTMSDQVTGFFNGPSIPGSVIFPEGSSITYNGAVIAQSILQQQASNAASNASQSIASAITEEANKTFGTDSVAEDVEYGFAGEIGATPPMDHRIDESGISLPRCVEEAREGVPCK
jgi:filamentous hemagglutinin family protein